MFVASRLPGRHGAGNLGKLLEVASHCDTDFSYSSIITSILIRNEKITVKNFCPLLCCHSLLAKPMKRICLPDWSRAATSSCSWPVLLSDGIYKPSVATETCFGVACCGTCSAPSQYCDNQLVEEAARQRHKGQLADFPSQQIKLFVSWKMSFPYLWGEMATIAPNRGTDWSPQALFSLNRTRVSLRTLGQSRCPWKSPYCAQRVLKAAGALLPQLEWNLRNSCGDTMRLQLARSLAGYN